MEIESIETSIYAIMREMDKDTKLVVQDEQWVLARNYASQLQRDFGVRFSIHRMRTKNTKLSLILIRRVD